MLACSTYAARSPMAGLSVVFTNSTKGVPELKQGNEEQLHAALVPLVSNLDETIKQLPPAEQHSYEKAEQSVVNARRKAETHEGLYQVS